MPTVPPFVVAPLDNSTPSRFSPNTLIGTLIDELFIEQWTKTSSYKNYFAACAPSLCRYEYLRRNSILYVVTSVLALYGGLTVGLRFIIWNSVRVYYLVKARLPAHHTTVQPCP
ncbi:unnamed protein product [Rotaria sp. Silwood1]|nr:unnamed protein product [Rotaria sp. Silwood1]